MGHLTNGTGDAAQIMALTDIQTEVRKSKTELQGQQKRGLIGGQYRWLCSLLLGDWLRADLLNLIEGVVVGADAGVVDGVEPHDNWVADAALHKGSRV